MSNMLIHYSNSMLTNEQYAGLYWHLPHLVILKESWVTAGIPLTVGQLGQKYGVFYSIVMCRMQQFLAVLRSLFHPSLLCTFSCHSSPPTILPSSLTSSCHLFLGLLLNLVVPKFIYNTLLEFYFLPFSVHAQTNIIYLTLLSVL